MPPIKRPNNPGGLKKLEVESVIKWLIIHEGRVDTVKEEFDKVFSPKIISHDVIRQIQTVHAEKIRRAQEFSEKLISKVPIARREARLRILYWIIKRLMHNKTVCTTHRQGKDDYMQHYSHDFRTLMQTVMAADKIQNDAIQVELSAYKILGAQEEQDIDEDTGLGDSSEA